MHDALVPVLAGVLDCGDEDAARIAGTFRFRAVASGEVIARQGEPCARSWIVASGALALVTYGESGQHAQVASYSPGEVTGAFPDAREQPGELVALDTTELIEAETAELRRATVEEHCLARGLAILMARQHDTMVARLANRMMLSATGRVYAELLRRADGEGGISPAPVVTALAMHAHTARETASRAIAAAVRRGLVERTGNGLRIVSVARLRELVV